LNLANSFYEIGEFFMTMKKRVVAGTSTHFDVREKVVVPDSEFGVDNHQDDMDLLIDPQDNGSVRTHSDKDVVFRGSKKVPTTAAIRDEQRTGPQDVHGIDHDVDPAAGYLEKEAGMPVVEVPVSAEFDDEFESEDGDIEADLDGDDEFDSLDPVEADDEFGDMGDETELEDDIAAEVEDDFVDMPDDESIAIADADEIADQTDGDELQFATIANAVHVIHSNRILASIGPSSAKKAGVADVYMTPQYQDVVAANISNKGLRKGLVQSGFVLAKVAIKASKHTSKAVQAKVTAAINHKVEAMEKQNKAMSQAMAIAAVGINRRYFKDASNDLKTNLEAELVQAGLRGGQNIVRAMFAKHGVSYAKSILTLATRIAAMPEEMRNQYAEALDMTEDDDFSDDIEADMDDGLDDDIEEDFDPIPASVTAALRSPVRRDAALLTAGVRSSAAMSILTGSQSLV
jgi:hypothetical protein